MMSETVSIAKKYTRKCLNAECNRMLGAYEEKKIAAKKRASFRYRLCMRCRRLSTSVAKVNCISCGKPMDFNGLKITCSYCRKFVTYSSVSLREKKEGSYKWVEIRDMIMHLLRTNDKVTEGMFVSYVGVKWKQIKIAIHAINQMSFAIGHTEDKQYYFLFDKRVEI